MPFAARAVVRLVRALYDEVTHSVCLLARAFDPFHLRAYGLVLVGCENVIVGEYDRQRCFKVVGGIGNELLLLLPRLLDGGDGDIRKAFAYIEEQKQTRNAGNEGLI